MNPTLLILAILIILFCGIVVFGAPFVPTKRLQIKTALDLLDLKKGQVIYELGAGDGRVALAAAKRGLKVVGFELNFLLLLIAKVKTRKYRSLVTIHWKNYWSADLSKADGVFIFSTSQFMSRLAKKLSNTKRGVRLVSFAFQIPNKKPTREKDGVFLYQY